MREEIRIRHKQLMGIDPSCAPGQGNNAKTMGNDPRNLFQAPWRIGDIISLMISANFKKRVHGSYIKFEYVDEIHKSMRLDILYKDVINEFLEEPIKNIQDDIYDPGLLWLTSPYYVKKYGYDIIPTLQWDKEEYSGPELSWGNYVVFSPLMDAQYNLERNMSADFVNDFCEKLKDEFGDDFYVITNKKIDILIDTKNINTLDSDSIYDLGYIISHSKCFIGGDSGFSHLAGSSRLPKQICIGWPKQRLNNFNWSEWPYYFINPFSIQGQFMNQTWDMFPQIDPRCTDYKEFLLKNNSLNEDQIQLLLTYITKGL
jgi:hypothetical protein